MIKLLRLRVELEGVTPAIWRTVVAPETLPLDRLHDVLQIVMGWDDMHQHMFRTKAGNFKEMIPDDDEFKDTKDEAEVLLQDVLKKKGDSFTYWYDFGDDWMHKVVLESKNAELDPDLLLPIFCVDGARSCPPEDSGGPMGYEHFCEAITNPLHPEYVEALDWYTGEDVEEGDSVFDPELFDVDMVNWDLIKYIRWSRPRKLPLM